MTLLALHRQKHRMEDSLIQRPTLQTLLAAVGLKAEHIDHSLQLRELEANKLTAAERYRRLLAIQYHIVGLRCRDLAIHIFYLQAIRMRAVMIKGSLLATEQGCPLVEDELN